MTWLVTGGAGYIGAHVVRAFRNDGIDVVVVTGYTSDEDAALYISEPTERIPVVTMDSTRKVAHLRFDRAPAERLGASDPTSVHRLLDRAALAVAAESLGGAERVAHWAGPLFLAFQLLIDGEEVLDLAQVVREHLVDCVNLIEARIAIGHRESVFVRFLRIDRNSLRATMGTLLPGGRRSTLGAVYWLRE